MKKQYKDRHRPHRYLGVVLGACLAAALFAFSIHPELLGAIAAAQYHPGKVVFVAYIGVYIIVWLFYFGSIEYEIDAQTLRRLLKDESKLWDNAGASPETVAFYREKSKTSITALAIIIAASTLLATRVYEAISLLKQRHLTHPLDDYQWSVVTLYVAIALACAAFLLLLISVDALDTTFNEFHTDCHKIVAYFYRQALYPKYFGLVSVIFAFIFYIASAFPEIAASATGLLLCAGYYHWFPDIYDEKPAKRRIHATVSILICLFPIAVLLVRSPVS